MTATKVVAQVGLVIEIVGVVLLAWASGVLVKASSTMDGIRDEAPTAREVAREDGLDVHHRWRHRAIGRAVARVIVPGVQKFAYWSAFAWGSDGVQLQTI